MHTGRKASKQIMNNSLDSLEPVVWKCRYKAKGEGTEVGYWGRKRKCRQEGQQRKKKCEREEEDGRKDWSFSSGDTG